MKVDRDEGEFYKENDSGYDPLVNTWNWRWSNMDFIDVANMLTIFTPPEVPVEVTWWRSHMSSDVPEVQYVTPELMISNAVWGPHLKYAYWCFP